MNYRSPRRWLAPVALAGAAVAILLTINAGGGGGGSGSGTSTAGASTPSASHTSTGAGRTSTTHAAKAKSYTVATGDVLSSIAQKTGVSLSRIEELNPSVQAQSLHVGQKIKLAP